MTDNRSGRVFLNGHLTVPVDRLEQVRAALPKHIALTRAESGCIAFDVVEDTSQPGHFLVAEVFKDQAAFDAHQRRTKSSDWFAITQGIPREYSITFGDEPSSDG